MSFTNHTPNYNLPQYVGTDKPTFLGDFNNAMSAIDTALHNNEQNAGEGLAELQQAQAALTETQETLTEVQTEVANVSGIASTVNQNVQQALSAANDATTAANSATSQIQPAVTAANQASADAQAAQQVANGNVATITALSERVTVLENEAIKTFTQSLTLTSVKVDGWKSFHNTLDISEYLRGITLGVGASTSVPIIFTKNNEETEEVTPSSLPYDFDEKFFVPGAYTKITFNPPELSGNRSASYPLTLTYGKYNAS